MKSMTYKSLSSLSIILTLLIFTSTSFASNNEIDTILEITDRYKEVKLGVTESSIYMVIDEKIRSRVNMELQNQYEKDLRDFDDTEGNFVPGSYSFLSSNIIEISFSDIDKIEFSNGTLRINYSRSVPVHFEDVISVNGNKALDNFYIEDLELLYQTALDQS